MQEFSNFITDHSTVTTIVGIVILIVIFTVMNEYDSNKKP